MTDAYDTGKRFGPHTVIIITELKMEHKIIKIMPGSIAEELEIEAGDVLVSVNGEEIEDVFDYQSLVDEEEVTLLIRKVNGEEWELEIEKEVYEDIGLVFESSLMSDYRGCTNQCVFCFIDQMPPGMRETLYFKDDDSRLSFLQGNYITGTNMSEKDIGRIIRYRMEPMNISVHTTNPELRKMMLHNRFADRILKYMEMFYEAGIHMNCQIVLCKDLNDGDELRRTLTDLYRFLPVLESVSVVPVGLTKYREGLYPLKPLQKEDALAAIAIIEEFQKKAFEAFGLHFVHASDELYLLAGLEFPEEERYDGYLQFENGVGMGRLLYEDSRRRIEEIRESGERPDGPSATFATGMLSKALLERVREMMLEAFPYRKDKTEIVGIRNDFFGPMVTVAGLVTGQDLIAQLKDHPLKDLLVLPNVMFRSGEEVFLDDVSRTDAEEALKVPVKVIIPDGHHMVDALLGLFDEASDFRHGEYELKE